MEKKLSKKSLYTHPKVLHSVKSLSLVFSSKCIVYLAHHRAILFRHKSHTKQELKLLTLAYVPGIVTSIYLLKRTQVKMSQLVQI